MKVVFFGNTKYSLIGAEIIHKELGLSYIATIPASPLQLFAANQQIPLLNPKRLDKSVVEHIRSIKPDFVIVEDYGLILPNELLKIPKYDSLNIHHSLLPKYRGPSPAPSAILAGEKISGVSIIHMTDKVDAGDIYAQKDYVLSPTETTDSLLKALNLLGGKLLVEVIKSIIEKKAKPQKQDEKKATYTTYMKKPDGFIDPLNPPSKEKIDRMIRAYFPWPGVWFKTKIGGQNRIVKLLPEQKIQVEGKKPMSYKDFVNGYSEGKKILEQLGQLD